MGRPQCNRDRDGRPRPGTTAARGVLRSDPGIRPDPDGARPERANASRRCRARSHRPDIARQGWTGRQTGDQDRIHNSERTGVPWTGKARQAAPYYLGIAAANPSGLLRFDNGTADSAGAGKELLQLIPFAPPDGPLQCRQILGEALHDLEHRFAIIEKNVAPHHGLEAAVRVKSREPLGEKPMPSDLRLSSRLVSVPTIV